MKKSGNGKGAFGRSRSGRPARRRLKINSNVGTATVLIIATALAILLVSPKMGVIVAVGGLVIWGGVALYQAQRRSLQQS